MDDARGTRMTRAGLVNHAVPGSSELDLRALGLAVVAGLSTFNSSLTLAGGVVLCLGVLVTKLGRGFRLEAADIWATCLACLAALSFYWAVSPMITWDSAVTQLKLLIIFVSFRAVAVNRRSLTVIAGGYCIGCLYALVLLNRQHPDLTLVVELSSQRYGIDGVNLNYLAYALATGCSLLVLLWYAGGTRRYWRLAPLLTAVPIYLGITLSGTRGAFLSVAGLFLWIVLGRLSPRIGLSAVYGLVILFGAAIVSGAVDGPLASLANVSPREDSGLGGRLYIWPLARRVFSDHLLTGIGASGFQTVNPLRVGSHNVFLEIGTGTGVVGVCVFVCLFFTAIVSSSRVLDSRRRAVLVGAYLSTVAPIYLSGQWDLSPAGWVALALFSRISVLAEPSS